jgi:hypothetical protein
MAAKGNARIFAPLTADLPLPDISSPRAFDAWWRLLGSTQANFQDAVQNLVATRQPLAFIRAAQLILASEDQAKELITVGLSSQNRVEVILSRVILETINVIKVYSRSDRPKEEIVLSIDMLEKLLEQIETCQENCDLLQEALARALLSISSALILKEDFPSAVSKSVMAERIADAFGIRSVVVSAQYQRACAELYSGSASQAHLMFSEIRGNFDATTGLKKNASNSVAASLYYMGDYNGLIEYSLVESSENCKIFAFMTLKLNTSESTVDTYKVTNGLRSSFNYWTQIRNALTQKPWDARRFFLESVDSLPALEATLLGSDRVAYKTLKAFSFFRCGKISRATASLPENTDLLSTYQSERIFGYAVRLEIFGELLPTMSNEYSLAIDLMVNDLQLLKPNLQSQIAHRLQLLTPLALATISFHPDCPESVINIGRQCIFDFSNRKVRVYNKEGIRPSQVIDFVLRDFGVDTEVASGGGRQRSVLPEILNQKYGDNRFWFVPVSALKLSSNFLLAQSGSDNSVTYWGKLAIEELKNKYGWMPNLQKAEPDSDFVNFHDCIKSLHAGSITPIAASVLLKGKGN